MWIESSGDQSVKRIEGMMVPLPSEILASVHEKGPSLGEPESVFPLSAIYKVLCWVASILLLLAATAAPIIYSLKILSGGENAKAIVIGMTLVFGLSGFAFIGWILYCRGFFFVVFRDALV